MSDLTSIFDGAAGSAQGKEGTTVETFALSLAAGFVLFSVQFTAFVILRNYLWAKRIYQPRCFLIPLKDRMKPPPTNIVSWFIEIVKIPSQGEVLQKAGMDAYFFLRYLTLCLKIFFPLACIILPILIPLNVVSGRDNNTINSTATYNITGLDRLAWSNVSPTHTNRYWAHLILGVGVIAWVCFLFHHELVHYISLRQDHLSSPSHRLKASSTTVLITDIPAEICTTEALTEMYDDMPGGIRRLWVNKNYQAIVEKNDYRKEIESILENAETDLMRKATKRSRKTHNKGVISTSRPSTTTSEAPVMHNEDSPQPGATYDEVASTTTQTELCEKDLQHDITSQAVWTQYLEPKHRPAMRIPKIYRKGAAKIPMVGKFFCDKVDTIYWCRRELARLNAELDKEIEAADSCPSNGSAFIQFNTQKAAHLACQAVADIKPRRMIQRTVEMSPADVNWASLNYSWQNRAVRLMSFLLLFLIVIFVFGLISFFTGILSKVASLAGSKPWLAWILDLPTWLLSFIQGTLPPVILVIILSGPTPIVLRAMTNSTRGAISGSQGERSLQLWYFIFLLLELFIIPTVSSGLTSIVQEVLSSPTSVPEILAKYLPTASNYYFSFLIVQALSISASSIFQTIRMLNYYVLGGYNTPDQLFERLTFTHLTRIGSNIPWYTTFAVIGLVYSVIAPLILPFVIVTFSLFWVVIKNNVLFVVRTGNVDSGGVWFPHAINQTFTGLYFMEACLVGLFFLVRDVNDNVACKAQGIIMAICIIFTVLYQVWLMKNFTGLFKYAPIRLAGIAAERENESELQRLTAPEIEIEMKDQKPPRIDEDSSPEHSFDTVKPHLDQGLTAEPRAVNSHDLEKDHTGGRRRRSTVKSAAFDRSKLMQAQQEHDQKRASHVLARLNRPLDEARLATLENRLSAAESKIGNVLLPRKKDIEARMMDDPISKIIMQHNDELEDLSTEERDLLVSVAFTHPVLRDTKPAIWIPVDDLGISEDEVKRTRALSPHLVIDNRGAYFNKKLKVQIDRAPPDMSEFALVMQEL